MSLRICWKRIIPVSVREIRRIHIRSRARGRRYIALMLVVGPALTVLSAWLTAALAPRGPSLGVRAPLDLQPKWPQLEAPVSWSPIVRWGFGVRSSRTRWDVFLLPDDSRVYAKNPWPRSVERLNYFSELRPLLVMEETYAGWPAYALRMQILDFVRPRTAVTHRALRPSSLRRQRIITWSIPLPMQVALTANLWQTSALPVVPVWPGFLINSVFWGALVTILVWLKCDLPQVIRNRRGRCTACGYNLSGLTRCPECGHAHTTESDNDLSRSLGTPATSAHRIVGDCGASV